LLGGFGAAGTGGLTKIEVLRSIKVVNVDGKISTLIFKITVVIPFGLISDVNSIFNIIMALMLFSYSLTNFLILFSCFVKRYTSFFKPYSFYFIRYRIKSVGVILLFIIRPTF